MPLPVLNSTSRGSGYPLVLLPAFPLSQKIWNKIKPPSGYRLVLPDFPGFGLSPLPNSKISMSDAAKGLSKHLLEQGIDVPVVLGGISMGGYWCLEFMRQFPEKVRALLLISTRAGIDSPEAKKKRLEIAEKVEKEGVQFLAQRLLPSLIGKTTSTQKPEIRQLVGKWILDASKKAVADAQRVMASRRDQNKLLSKVKVPVLVIAGAEDMLIPLAETQSMGRTVKNSQIRVVKEAGHLIPVENPIEFQKCLNEFVSELDPKGTI